MLAEAVQGQRHGRRIDRLAQGKALAKGALRFIVLAAHGQDAGEIEQPARDGAVAVAEGFLANDQALAQHPLRVAEMILMFPHQSKVVEDSADAAAARTIELDAQSQRFAEELLG